MDYKLICEGFPLDDELRDKLLLSGRRFVVSVGAEWPVTMTVKQIDGLVQARVELMMPGRKLSVIVRRSTPTKALEAAVSAMSDTLTDASRLDPTGTG